MRNLKGKPNIITSEEALALMPALQPQGFFIGRNILMAKTSKERMRDYRKRHYEKLHTTEEKNRLCVLQKQYRKNNKIEILTHYGNGSCSCVQCNESRIDCLSIDHMNGNGNKHKKLINRTSIYSWLRKNNYPTGYQTLCMNCQWVKRFQMNEHV